MNIPTEDDWKSEPWMGLETQRSYRDFFGKSLDEAIALFEAYALGHQESVYYMPATCFRFYVMAYIEYLLSPKSEHDSDAANCFFGLVEGRLETITESEPQLRDSIISCLLRLEDGQEWYRANEGIYGNFKSRARNCLKLLRQDDVSS